MAANALVQARIEATVKDEAAIVLAAMGLTVSDAVRLLLTSVAREHDLPFDPLVPNAKTIEAMKEARLERLNCCLSRVLVDRAQASSLQQCPSRAITALAALGPQLPAA